MQLRNEPSFIYLSNREIAPNIIDQPKDVDSLCYSQNVFMQVNPLVVDEIGYTQYVRADKYYKVLKVLNKLISNKQRLEEIEEMACKILLES